MNLTQTVTDPMPTKRCAAAHIAPWLIEVGWFNRALRAVKDGVFQPQALVEETDERVAFQLDGRGVAVINIDGPIMKIDSKFGGTNSIRVRSAIRAAIADNDVEAIFIVIDSPGGTCAGTEELAREVMLANRQKPVFVHCDDLMCSAAFWVASQATRITANETGTVGSIGTLLVLEDTSEATEMEGIKVRVIATGEFKGAAVDGTPITDAHLAHFQEWINDLNNVFLAAVAKGRRLPIETVRKLADGRAHIAAKAKAMGLIDAVQPQDDAFAFAVRAVDQNRKARRTASKAAAALAADVAGCAESKLEVDHESGLAIPAGAGDSTEVPVTLAQIPWRQAVAASGKDSDLEAVAKLRGVEIVHDKTLGSETPKPEVGPDGGFIVPPEIADKIRNHRYGGVTAHWTEETSEQPVTISPLAGLPVKSKESKPKGRAVMAVSGPGLNHALRLPDGVEIVAIDRCEGPGLTHRGVRLLLEGACFPVVENGASYPEVHGEFQSDPENPEFMRLTLVDTAEPDGTIEGEVNSSVDGGHAES